MRLVTYDAGAGPRAGMLVDGGLHDAGPSLRALLASGADPEPGEPVESARLLPPVPDPQKIIGIGLNYREHAEEAGLEPPATPTFFGMWANALVPDGAAVTLPTQKCDYEAEVAFVIGAGGRIGGYTLLNDLSARDRQFATPQWMPGKVFDGAAPCGPWLVTPDEAGPSDAIEIELHLNGELRQQGSTAGLVHSIPDLLEHLGTLMTLAPGDIVATGTPSGTGASREPREYLKPGDEVVISSPTLGALTTRFG
ncbi:MAG: fumarylacetoacetate hydrolase family protein [Thermoleophilaceae bacterium]|nr:fumarylacetoacetate hydrolase family protein [Thermoleophilaceae bacterium]